MGTTVQRQYVDTRNTPRRRTRETHLLIIGAGPFGLGMAACAQHLELDYLIVGEPMDLWKSNMPREMILRSHIDWHLDPLETHSLEHYLTTRGLSRESVEPLSRDFYLEYADWFQSQKNIKAVREQVQDLDTKDGNFVAKLGNGETIVAKNVVMAIGFRYFKNIPAELQAMLPSGHYSHTCDLVEFEHLQNKRCLIIGGRQSAFEWAALLAESGAAEVHVAHRHPTPLFQDAEWGWINDAVSRFVDDPDWYRNLSGDEKLDVHAKFAEARIKLEPWLWPRIDKDNVKLWPQSQVTSCTERPDGKLDVVMDNGQSLVIDHVILATGYQVNMNQVPFIGGNIRAKLNLNNGYPALDNRLQSSIERLFITSLPAMQDFGPFFAFTVAVKVSAKIIARALLQTGEEK
jgi:cation diffusion facilitator CzcD-associated flavoprotein CzcO